MKTSKQCPKCQSLRVGHLEDVPEHHVGEIARPKNLFGGNEKYYSPIGRFEAYLCAQCGFYETYIKTPNAIPFEELDGFNWINDVVPPDGPYR